MTPAPGPRLPQAVSPSKATWTRLRGSRPGCARSYKVSLSAPQGFEAYARIFFPFMGEDIKADGAVSGQEYVT